MDNDLELFLIKAGYDPREAKEIKAKNGSSVNDVGKIIKEEFYQKDQSGIVLLGDGSCSSIFMKGDFSSFAMWGGTLAIKISKSNMSFSEQIDDIYYKSYDNPSSANSASISMKESYYIDVPKVMPHPLADNPYFDIKSNDGSVNLARISWQAESMIYMPKISDGMHDKLFWQHLAKRFALETREVENPYPCKAETQPVPWYSAEQEGIHLMFGTRGAGSWHVVRSEFPSWKSTEELLGLTERRFLYTFVDGNNWNSYVDGKIIPNPEIEKGGKVLEVFTCTSSWKDIVKYLDNFFRQ